MGNVHQFKYTELIFYLIFGVLTTAVNIAVYFICSRIFYFQVISSNITAWLLSVLFAYLTNRKFVFISKAEGFSSVLKECMNFFLGRLSTGILDTVIMFVSVDLLAFNDVIMKVLSNIIVIVLNYLISKLLVFRTKGEQK